MIVDGEVANIIVFITADKVVSKGLGEKEKWCTAKCKRANGDLMRWPWALNYGSGEGGGHEKWRRGGENRARHV